MKCYVALATIGWQPLTNYSQCLFILIAFNNEYGHTADLQNSG